MLYILEFELKISKLIVITKKTLYEIACVVFVK